MTSTVAAVRYLLDQYPCRAAAPLSVQWVIAELEAQAEAARRRLRAWVKDAEAGRENHS